METLIQEIAQLVGYQPSKYQEALVDFVVNGSGHGACSAVAGSGKSSSLGMAMIALKLAGKRPSQTRAIVFGKKNATELKAKFSNLLGKAWGESVSTLHSAGFGILREYLGLVGKKARQGEVSESKYRRIAQEQGFLSKGKIPGSLVGALTKERDFLKLVDLIRLTNQQPTPEAVLEIAAHNQLEAIKQPETVAAAIAIVLEAGERQAEQEYRFDYVDQIWLPVKWCLHKHSWFKTYEFVCLDEAQDLNAIQLELTCMLAGTTGRILAVGDEHQSIMGFAGADCESFQTIVKRLNAKAIPLNICYRCPKSHIDLVKRLFPYIPIEARSNAPLGALCQLKEAEIEQQLEEGDMVLCRKTAPLVNLCVRLISRGIAATVEGRKIGQALIDELEEISKMPGFEFSRFNEASATYLDIKGQRYAGADNEEKLLEDLKDKLDALETIFQSQTQASSIEELGEYIESLFSDGESPITLSTAHRSKGLEAERIFIIQPDSLPLVWKDQLEWQLQQEDNLHYVSLTRSKHSLFIVGDCDWLEPSDLTEDGVTEPTVNISSPTSQTDKTVEPSEVEPSEEEAETVEPIASNRDIVNALRLAISEGGLTLDSALEFAPIKELAAGLDSPMQWRERPTIAAFDLIETLCNAGALSIKEVANQVLESEDYDYTEYAISAEERVREAFEQLIDWGYAHWDEQKTAVIAIEEKTVKAPSDEVFVDPDWVGTGNGVICRYVGYFSDRSHYFAAPELRQLEVLSETATQLRVKDHRNIVKSKAYCLPSEASWLHLKGLRDELHTAMQNLASKIRELGHYPDQLKRIEAEMGNKTPNPLTSCVFRAINPDHNSDYSGYGYPWNEAEQFFLSLRRFPVIRHTPQMLRYEVSGQREDGSTWDEETITSQNGHFLLPDESAWEDLQQLRATALLCRSQLADYLEKLDTYDQAAADGQHVCNEILKCLGHPQGSPTSLSEGEPEVEAEKSIEEIKASIAPLAAYLNEFAEEEEEQQIADDSSVSTEISTGDFQKDWVNLGMIDSQSKTQSRAKVKQARVKDYAAQMKQGMWDWKREPLPVLFYDEATNVCYPGDGHQRIEAAGLAELETIYAEVRPGDVEDARLFSAQANSFHGEPRTNKDKRNAVALIVSSDELLDRLATQLGQPGAIPSDRAIAEFCHVSAPFVKKVLNALGIVLGENRVDRSGRAMNVKNLQAEEEESDVFDEGEASSSSSGKKNKVDPLTRKVLNLLDEHDPKSIMLEVARNMEAFDLEDLLEDLQAMLDQQD